MHSDIEPRTDPPRPSGPWDCRGLCFVGRTPSACMGVGLSAMSIATDQPKSRPSSVLIPLLCTSAASPTKTPFPLKSSPESAQQKLAEQAMLNTPMSPSHLGALYEIQTHSQPSSPIRYTYLSSTRRRSLRRLELVERYRAEERRQSFGWSSGHRSSQSASAGHVSLPIPSTTTLVSPAMSAPPTWLHRSRPRLRPASMRAVSAFWKPPTSPLFLLTSPHSTCSSSIRQRGVTLTYRSPYGSDDESLPSALSRTKVHSPFLSTRHASAGSSSLTGLGITLLPPVIASPSSSSSSSSSSSTLLSSPPTILSPTPPKDLTTLACIPSELSRVDELDETVRSTYPSRPASCTSERARTAPASNQVGLRTGRSLSKVQLTPWLLYLLARVGPRAPSHLVTRHKRWLLQMCFAAGGLTAAVTPLLCFAVSSTAALYLLMMRLPRFLRSFV